MNSPTPTQDLGAIDPPKPRLRGRSHEYAFVVALTLTPIMIVVAPGILPRFVVALYATAIAGLSASARSTTASTGAQQPGPG